MATETATFALPTTRVGGAALPLSQVSRVQFLLQTGTGAFVQLTDIPNAQTALTPTGTTTIQQVLAPGSYVLRGIVWDTQTPSVASAPRDAAFVVPASALAAPNALTTLTVTVTP